MEANKFDAPEIVNNCSGYLCIFLYPFNESHKNVFFYPGSPGLLCIDTRLILPA
jgi:hypothetical protein